MNSQEFALYINVALYASAIIYSFFKLGKKINAYVGVLFVYLISSIMGIFHYYSPLSFYHNLTIFPFLFLFVGVLIFIYPVYSFCKFTSDNRNVTHCIRGIPNQILLIITVVSFSLCLIPLIEGLYGLLSGLANISEFKDYLADAHDDRQEGYTKDMFQYSFIGMISFRLLLIIFESSFFLLFYCIAKHKNIWYVLTYSIVILTVVLNQVLVSARSTVLYSVLLLLLNYLIFKVYLPEIRMYRIKRYMSIIIVAAIVGLLTITVSRSEKSRDDNYLLYFTAWYAGESTLNFNEYIFDRRCNENGDYNFPMLKKFLGLKTFEDNYKRRSFYASKSGVPEHIFYTFIGNLITDFGWLIALMILITSSLMISFDLSNYKSNRVVSIPIVRLFLFSFIVKIAACGIFYNPYSGFIRNRELLYFFFWLIVFYISSSPKYSREILLNLKYKNN